MLPKRGLSPSNPSNKPPMPPDLPLRAILLAAVSTPEQATDDKISIPHQISLAEAAAALHGWQIMEHLIIAGYSRYYFTVSAAAAAVRLKT